MVAYELVNVLRCNFENPKVEHTAAGRAIFGRAMMKWMAPLDAAHRIGQMSIGAKPFDFTGLGKDGSSSRSNFENAIIEHTFGCGATVIYSIITMISC